MAEEEKHDLLPQNKQNSPYDVTYPATLLSDGIKTGFARAQDSVEQIYRTVIRALPAATQLQQALQKGCRYVVDASEDTLKAIEDGTIKLTQENGKTYAQLKVNGKYGKKLPIKKEVFRKGIDATQMANALQMQAMQDQIQDVANQLILIGGSVKEILQGQQNDRIGLYYSGISLFLEAQSVSDADLKSTLQAQALRALAESTFQLKLTMQADIRYLAQKEYDKAKGKRKELIIEHMNNINRAFAFIHQSSMLRAGIYCHIGEQSAMARVLDEYSHFIETDIAQNAELLSQYDLNDNGLQNGLWKSRTQLKLDTAGLAEMLDNPPKVLYLGIETENENHEENQRLLKRKLS